MKKFVKVPIKEYIELKQSESDLCALESAGIDNWCWYEVAEFEEYTEDDIILPIIEEE